MHPFLQRSLLKAELHEVSTTLPSQAAIPSAIPYHPSITRRSHDMLRSGDVGHRLYEEATRQAARLRDLETAASREAETRRRASSIHSPEARRLRTAAGSRRGGGGNGSGSGGNATDVGGGDAAAAVTRATDLLYRNASQLAKRKAALRAEVEAEARELSKPKMNE